MCTLNSFTTTFKLQTLKQMYNKLMKILATFIPEHQQRNPHKGAGFHRLDLYTEQHQSIHSMYVCTYIHTTSNRKASIHTSPYTKLGYIHH